MYKRQIYRTPHIKDAMGASLIIEDILKDALNEACKNLKLKPEETDLEQLNLCIFAGTESEDAHRYAPNAVAVQTVYEIPLTVTDSSDMEGMDV